ncbi:FecR domain-containing protein [Chitinophaga sp. CC14]|uniref:FecR family protein n=1 Tax=Chitinophaga sp. CC14 TaxID=3029199 RepID=UPI003B815277
MPQKHAHIVTIIHRSLQGEPLSQEEQHSLDQWLAASEANREVFRQVQDPKIFAGFLSVVSDHQATDNAYAAFTAARTAGGKVRALRRWGWAAAILALLATGTYLFTSSNNKRTIISQVPPKTDNILPGTNKATLTLSDGSSIILDSAANGAIAQQGNSSIIKLANDEIKYDQKGLSQGEIMTNTMSTPAGGQYKLVLPDGTKVWLNAASSISYPVVFIGDNRRIEVSGEVYLEVAPNKNKPFIAGLKGGLTVQVLGTSFNINAYADDGEIKTTLVEGRVKVLSSNSITLKPGQQAIQISNTGELTLRPDADLEKVLAWKNGMFNFTGLDFKLAMKDIERWYNIQVKYEGTIPAFKLKGKMDKGVQLSDLIRFIEGFGLQVRQEGRTLTIKEPTAGS